MCQNLNVDSCLSRNNISTCFYPGVVKGHVSDHFTCHMHIFPHFGSRKPILCHFVARPLLPSLTKCKHVPLHVPCCYE